VPLRLWGAPLTTTVTTTAPQPAICHAILEANIGKPRITLAAMSIVITVATERNAELERLDDADDHLGRLLLQGNPGGLLGGIDPFGDAMFNRLQIPALHKELVAQLSRPERAPGEHAFLEQVADLAQRASDRGPHIHLWFRGD